MKSLFLVANWKSNKTINEAENWLEQLKNNLKTIPEEKQIIICPAYTILSDLKRLISKYNLPFKLGAQDISQYPEGEYTGEINGQQIKELADFVIIGHSERRKDFSENQQILSEKTLRSKENNLKTIFCVAKKEDLIPSDVDFVVYEPLFAIGSGDPDSPESAEQMAKFIKGQYQTKSVLYGGSVNSQNVKTFISMPNIDGVLVGHASLDPLEFAKIIEFS